MSAYRPRPTEMETATGHYVDVQNPDPLTIHVEDIAHHLARICRYTGAVNREHYSVAEHAVLVADRLRTLGYRPEVRLAGLHHDDTEAYLGDVSSPLKAILPAYRRLEQRMADAIAAALNLPLITADEVAAIHDADRWALAIEAASMLPDRGAGWACWTGPGSPTLYDLLPDRGEVFPIEAQHDYLMVHRALWCELAEGEAA